LAARTDKQLSYALFAEWKKLYKASTRTEYRGNIHRDAGLLFRIIEDIGYDAVKRAMQHYCKANPDASFTYFVYNYDKVIESMELLEQDREHRARLREETRRRMEEYLRDN
jgi:hypothetical protein